MLVTDTGDIETTTDLVLGAWSVCSFAPNSISHPEQLDPTSKAWIEATVPGTVAAALQAAGQWDMNQPPQIDHFDWWYRTTFSNTALTNQQPCWLTFDGLTAGATVWLNGERILNATNMFRSWRVDVSSLLQSENELVLAFPSMTAELQKKRPRPRWKTALVSHQQLRWQRTSLLGRIPAWSPPVPPIGPWRKVTLECNLVELLHRSIQTKLDGDLGIVQFAAELYSAEPIQRAVLKVGELSCELEVDSDNARTLMSGSLNVPDAPKWWPHTHGDQPQLTCQLTTYSEFGMQAFDCGKVGFRSLRIDRTNGFQLFVNGVATYVRGGCWTIGDLFRLDASEDSLRRELSLAKAAGANMLRIIGTMIYESDLFYQLCDEFGLMVWQDFTFANMDYPVDDPEFLKNIQAEAIEQLHRLSCHPCLMVYCGNSEIEQQASMLGMPREIWSNCWFSETLPGLCAIHHAGAEYVPSTPTGGLLPFHADSGISHYYGIGAYRRPLTELRQANVKFTPECLGFANIPEADVIHEITDGAFPVTHHPKWKQRVPRDSGAGWDFEDIRDFYLNQIYGLDATTLRMSDLQRYLDLSRTVPGEMMHRTFSEWRSSLSENQGGLVWFWKDLWPAAGWGVTDHLGQPKSTYYYLKRTWQPQQIVLTDEGINGLKLHILNELPKDFRGSVQVVLLKEPNTVVARAEASIECRSFDQTVTSADEILGGFYDVNYAYRFGPLQHHVVIATLFDADHQVLSEAFYFVQRRDSVIAPADLTATAQLDGDVPILCLQSNRFLHSVRLSSDGYLPDDNYFHLSPFRMKEIRFMAKSDRATPFSVDIEALNLDSSTTVSLSRPRDRSEK